MDKPQTETDYFYQDGAVLYTKDADGNRSSMNLLGTSANVIATSRGTGDSESWYLYNKDIRESTTSITGADGTAAATYEYDDFGNTMVTSGRNFDNEICYTGQIYDQSSGLYYYNARFYDPENARFLTQDTYRGEATQPDTLHLYAYCANNPINYVDPTGHDAIWLKAPKFLGGLAGHAALLLKHNGSWWYFSWGLGGYQKCSFKKLKKNYYKNGKLSYKLNKETKRKKNPYTKFIYLKGNFSKGYNYARETKQGKHYRNYNITTVNCAWMALQLLRKSSSGKRKSKIYNLQFYKQTVHKGWKTYYIYRKRTVVPNTVSGKIANIYGSKEKNIK